MLSWIPLLGPIIDGIVSVFTKIQDKDIIQYKTDADVYKAQMVANNNITMAFIHDIPVRLARDMIMFPGALWCGLYLEGKIVEKMHPAWVWAVKPLDGPMVYLPFILMSFFFGSAVLTWTRK